MSHVWSKKNKVEFYIQNVVGVIERKEEHKVSDLIIFHMFSVIIKVSVLL